MHVLMVNCVKGKILKLPNIQASQAINNNPTMRARGYPRSGSPAKAVKTNGKTNHPNSSKTTIFNALTRGQIETAAYSSGKLEVHTAMVDVPDERVDTLSKMFKPKKTIRAQVQYNDIAGLARGIGEKGGIDGTLLNQIAQNDALLHVIRAFDDENVPHIEGSVDPRRDLEILDTELILSDLAVVERRIERIAAQLGKRGGTPADRDALAKDSRGVDAPGPG